MYYGTGDPTKWQLLLASVAAGKAVESCPFTTPRFVVKYRDISTDHPRFLRPVRSMVVIAIDAEQAREKFMGPDSGYEIVSVERMPKRPQAVLS